MRRANSRTPSSRIRNGTAVHRRERPFVLEEFDVDIRASPAYRERSSA
jgi:hypothetical protein